MKEKDSSFVKVNNPKSARRMILENTRDILKTLQSYEDYKILRQKRLELINIFKIDVAEISSSIQQFKRMLPKTAVGEGRKAIVPKMVEEPHKELKKLEQELADVESKLNQLS